MTIFKMQMQIDLVLLILNRRRELGLPMFKSDLSEFFKLCKQSRMIFPECYFVGV